ncbi:SMI1/KNR4 family protein [Massilia genomosp. 1]|uniref:Knr4/Smi1-like domain-containing protein n=1 Tax=Massilia genomosp. 1 TaxID=2609280 RepID=A0ABX0N215_9BURK|nr:SMI1/KNR4 family protein [Massilia genomosp. 1]NHZ67045.1 hypothetical protein [Massilia genomosp. 1]
MNISNELINLLMPYIKDAAPLDEVEIRKFAAENNIILREDHKNFLMKIGRPRNGRLYIFHRYGGDFDFENLVDDFLEVYPDVDTPSGSTYFGTNFVGDSFCIDDDTGKIYLYSTGEKYGVVHETIEGFLLECLITAYRREAFSTVISKDSVGREYINEFRLINNKYRLSESTRYSLEYGNINNLEIFSEYFFVDKQLIVIHPVVDSLIVMSGGILNELRV